MSLLSLCEWLANTRGSIALHESILMYPLVESVHVWALTLFVGMAVLLDLRLLGVAMRRVPVSTVAQRLLPITTTGFVVMVISGFLLFYAIPVRNYQNLFFRAKVVLLILAGLNAWYFHANIYMRVGEWEMDTVNPKSARAAGMVSLILWLLIVFCGRMIAYNWFDCDQQPQPTWVNVLAACQPDSPRR